MKIGKWVEEFSKDLAMKNYAESTIATYSKEAWTFLDRFKASVNHPKEISSKKIKQYLRESPSIPILKQRIGAIKSFYKYTINQPLKFRYIEYPKKEKKLPKVIDQELIKSKLSNISNIKHKAILSIAYSIGLRVSEVVNLKIEDIDSKRMLIHIKNSKGKKDRIAPLSEYILKLLRSYYCEYRPKTFLFNGQSSLQYSTTSCQKLFKKYIDNNGHFHILRHSSATHALESGTDISLIQKMLGHNSIKTTMIYTHVSNKMIQKINTPL